MIPRIVLGFCAEIATTEYTFAYVLAAAHEGRLLKADFSMFPPQGSIYVPRPLFPHQSVRFRDLGFWDVEEDPNFGDRNRGAKYRAFRLRADVPAEVVRVDCPSYRADEVRQHLIERGIEAFYRLDGRDLMLEFADGVTAGPVRVEPADDDGRFRCDPEHLGQPLGAWPNRGALQPVLVNMGQTARWFVWPLPRPESFIDLASTRQVLDSLQHIGISQELYDDLIGKLGFIDHASLVPPLHRKRLQVLLDEALTTGKQLEACVPLLRDDPKMLEAVEQYKHQVGEEYRRDLETQKSQLGDEVGELEARKKGVEDQIEEVRKRLIEEESLKEKTAESVAEAVFARARQAQKEVHGMLAEVAVLRPFLSNGAAPTPALPAARALAVETHRHEAVPLAGTDAAYSHLKSQLENIGLQPRSASAAARETLTALSLGQAVFLQGSMAAVLARTITSALSGARWVELDVPADMKDGALVKPVVEAAAAEEGPTMLVLNGANRSCIDAYGSDLIRILAERAAGVPSAPGLMLIGVLSEGLSAVPPDPVLTALGPILHTDYLAWKRGWKARPTHPGQLTAGPWPHPDGPDEAALDYLLDELQPTPNELWRHNVLAADRRLAGWPGEPGAPDALDSVLFGWVLPRCTAAGVDLSEHADAFRQLFPEPDEMDPRLRLLLKAHGAAEVF
ncbi:MAG TPA: hypothetical protein DDY78_01185 [Planctomycetales bacterium]|jgi:hypothetical protein|nr:hypothetical protein [Planctomycetales bacterium]